MTSKLQHESSEQKSVGKMPKNPQTRWGDRKKRGSYLQIKKNEEEEEGTVVNNMRKWENLKDHNNARAFRRGVGGSGCVDDDIYVDVLHAAGEGGSSGSGSKRIHQVSVSSRNDAAKQLKKNLNIINLFLNG